MRKPSIVLAAVITFGCGANSPPQIYSSVWSPSGQLTAIKQYRGDEQVLWDVLVIKHEDFGDHTTAILQNQPVNGVWGSDGVVLGSRDKICMPLICINLYLMRTRHDCGAARLMTLVAWSRRKRGMLDHCTPTNFVPRP